MHSPPLIFPQLSHPIKSLISIVFFHLVFRYVSLNFCMSVYLSITILTSISAFLSRSFSIFLFLSVYLSLSLSLHKQHSLTLYISLFLTLSLYISLPLSHSLSLSFFLLFSLSRYLFARRLVWRPYNRNHLRVSSKTLPTMTVTQMMKVSATIKENK